MRPDLTIVIPTQGRATLPRCLASLWAQFHDGYRAEVLVVADTHSPLLMDVRAACRAEGVTYLEHDAGYHDWGYPGLRYGYEQASGSHILNIGDDDAYIPGALPAIMAAIEEVGEGPVMFRAEMHPSPNRGNGRPVVLWSQQRLEEQVITGQNLATPNVPGRIGGWSNDWKHALETVALWGGLVHWREEIIVRCY
jgi:glycosyltransferase involved in cell wall biosynthesis